MNTPRETSFVVSAKYLILPIQNNVDHGPLTLSVDGEIVFDCDVALAADPEQADWHAFFSLERFAGQRATVCAATATESAFAAFCETPSAFRRTSEKSQNCSSKLGEPASP